MKRLLAAAAVLLAAVAAGADTSPEEKAQVILMGPGDAFMCTAATGCIVMPVAIFNALLLRAKQARSCGPTT